MFYYLTFYYFTFDCVLVNMQEPTYSVCSVNTISAYIYSSYGSLCLCL
jgi:hypothetical protein